MVGTGQLVGAGGGGDTGAGAIVITRFSVSEPQSFSALITIVEVPLAVGVPDMVAVEVPKLKPLGNDERMLNLVVVEVTPVVVAVMV